MSTWQIILGCCSFGIAFVILQYCSKARKKAIPLLSESYLALSEEEKKYFDKDAEYQRITVLYSMIGLFFIFVGIMILTINKIFGFLAIASLLGALIYSIIKLIQLKNKK